MNAVELLGMQLRGSCDQIAASAHNVQDVWTRRVFENASLPGFVIWHCARIIDWGVHSVVRDAPEVGASVHWRERIRFDLGHGAGLTREQADEAARTVTADDVAVYAGALREDISTWLEHVTDAELDRTVDMRRAGGRNPLYSTDAAWEEVKHLDGALAWQFLMRPCGSHIRTHIGEAEALAASARAAAALGSA